MSLKSQFTRAFPQQVGQWVRNLISTVEINDGSIVHGGASLMVGGLFRDIKPTRCTAIIQTARTPSSLIAPRKESYCDIWPVTKPWHFHVNANVPSVFGLVARSSEGAEAELPLSAPCADVSYVARIYQIVASACQALQMRKG